MMLSLNGMILITFDFLLSSLFFSCIILTWLLLCACTCYSNKGGAYPWGRSETVNISIVDGVHDIDAFSLCVKVSDSSGFARRTNNLVPTKMEVWLAQNQSYVY